MLIILSPAKILNTEPQNTIQKFTLPEFLTSAKNLVNQMREMSASEMAKLLAINSKIAHQNTDRYYLWHLPFTPQNAKQAILTYNGEVFHGLDAKSLSDSDIDYLQSHLRILSGLYGVLRPLDLIQPYRLEISSKLVTEKGTNLYAYWTDAITKNISEAIEQLGAPKIILNLASGEYIKSINTKNINAKIINFEFLESKDEGYKGVVIYTKKARGMMVRYVIKNRIADVEDLKGFNAEGYWYNEQMSTEEKIVFVR